MSKAEKRKYCDEAAARLCDSGYKPLVARVLAARGINEPDDIQMNMCDLPGIKGGSAEKAATLLAEKSMLDKKWCILGDYDADGMCSTALAKLTLDALGVESDWLLSHRDHSQRSVDPSMVKKAKDMGAKVIITVDGGTNSAESIALAKELGMTVVITDHHPLSINGKIPDADAIVNPQLDGNGLPSAGMCGTVVMLALARELFRKTGSKHRAGKFIDLAAIATMTDVMPMDDRFNRSVVMAGIDSIRKGRCRPAIKAILGVRYPYCYPSDLNFQIGPMLNSAHRISNAELGVKALLADDIATARRLADELSHLNRERRLHSSRIYEEADALLLGFAGHGAVAFNASWNPSIMGLVANKLVDKLRVPVAMLCEHEGVVRGSMRSVSHVSLLDVLDGVQSDSPDLLGECGGHPYAAGVRLNGTVERFRELFDSHCERLANQGSAARPLMVDGSPTVEELSDGSVRQLNEIPWGHDEFPKPRFEGRFTVLSSKPTRRGNGFFHELELDGTVVKSYHSQIIGKPGTTIQMSYSVSADNANANMPFIHPAAMA